MVTMSGCTPWFWKPQKWEPVRPKPVCTSSAIQTPPAALTSCTQSYVNDALLQRPFTNLLNEMPPKASLHLIRYVHAPSCPDQLHT